MSSGSDWVNLFVHQGKELIDSVSRLKKDEALPSKSQKGDSASDTSNVGVSFSNSSDGTINFEGNSSRPGQSTSMALGAEADSSSVVKEKTLTQGQKEVYEIQLEQLQEQLVDIMIKKQEMDAELTMLREGDVSKLNKELEREKIKRKQLEVKLKKLKQDDDTIPKLRRRRRQDGSSTAEPDEQTRSDDQQTTENINIGSDHQHELPKGDQSRISRFKFWVHGLYISLVQRITLTFWNIVSDLSEDESGGGTVDDDGAPLAVKTLKDNINRFSNGLKPIKEFFNKITWVLSWKNPAATMLIFLVYVFSFWHGFTVSLLLFLFIVQLSANFIYSRFGTISDPDKTETSPEPTASWSDRFQVVLHVARKVQNILGNLSDNLEKIKNLLTWKVHHVTLKLYMALWFLFLSSIFLTGPQFFMLLGMLLGYKLFVIGPLYNRFPKLKKRYDTTHHLWLELPTDCEVGDEERQTDIDETQSSSAHRPSLSLISDSCGMNSRLFCERYKLTSDEVFVKGWEEGWRTSLMNKQRPLVHIKHGRLYLTQNYLCFERSRTNVTKNILIKLSDVRSVKKYKPLFILPGTGMSIEVCVKDKPDEPYIFGAMIGRDDAYNDIMQTARNAELSWAK